MTLSTNNEERLEYARNIVQANNKTAYDKATVLNRIKELLPTSALLEKLRKTFNEGEIILKEHQQNDKLYIILEGYISQEKFGAGMNTPIDLLGPGDFVGLLSFQTGEPAFTTTHAKNRVETLCLDRQNFDLFLTRYPEISKVIQGLIFSNLSDRYRRVVTLHVEVALLSKQLEHERNQLQKAISELEKTRNMLISQEKMATLGELTAGLAHEINNPAAALLRSVEYLIQTLPNMAERASALPNTGLVRLFFEAGFKRDIDSSAQIRARQKDLATRYPLLSRTDLRVVAEMNEPVFSKLHPFLENKKNQELVILLLDAYQSGVFLGGIKRSTSRIEYLVKSLKSYSRQNGAEPEVIDLRHGIKETLMILGNRLTNIQVTEELPEIPLVHCFVGELNQVWTNIIINACDAMNDEGELFISCGQSEDNYVWIAIADSGPGVPDMIKNRIFDPSFTTKTAGGEFGLGIGLAITKGIVEKHRGSIVVKDRPQGGAEFLIKLPASNPQKKS